MHCVLLEHGCCAEDTIVSCGEDTAIPHMTGTGPLRADEPIIIDLFPVHEKSGYYADMTRTFVKGEPSPEILEMYTALREAKQLAISRVKSGVSGADLYQLVVDFFKERGYDSDTRGFVHNLGHGVGLQMHELPTVGPSGKPLETGNVITIEPGLYYPDIGGVRLEDIGAVTKKGFDNFTSFSRGSGHMKDEIFDKYREAGLIAAKILRDGAKEIRIGAPYLDIVESIESRVIEEGAALAFPLNLSLNEDAAHDTASSGDTRIFAKGDVAKLDLGVQVDGYIADTATTIDLGTNSLLVEASRQALEAAISIIRPGSLPGILAWQSSQKLRAGDTGQSPTLPDTGSTSMSFTGHPPSPISA